MKHHLAAKFINELRDTAVKYKNCQQLRSRLRSVVDSYIDLTADDDLSITNEWYIQDKNILVNALKEIYANRGEDAFIKASCLEALEKTNS